MDTKITSEQTSFEELLEARLKQLLAKVGNAAIEDVEKDLLYLHSLINRYRRIDELLENLITPTIESDERPSKRFLEELREQHIRVAENRVEAERLHAKSHRILEHSAHLLAQIDRQIFERTHKGSEYAPELCALCRGIGGRANAPCIACKGRRTVLVHQPALSCPRCNGTGKPNEHDRIQFSSNFCLVCRGRGWSPLID
jgi:hypothetical protein